MPDLPDRTRWSAIVQDWSFVAKQSDNIYRCYRLSNRAAAALLGICEYLSWNNRWLNLAVAQKALRELQAAVESGLLDPLSCDSENCTFYDCMWPVFEYQYHWPANDPPPPEPRSWSYDSAAGVVYALSNVGRSTPEIYFTLPHGASCTIHLQTQLLGGKVQIFDGGMSPVTTVDLYADLTTIPPETVSVIEIPLEAYTEDKLITIRFTASFDSEEIPVTFGGGFLGVTFCGDITIMPFQLRQNEDNPCLLEQTLDGGAVWLTAFDYALCQTASSETIYRYDSVTNKYQISQDGGQTWQDSTTVVQLSGTTFPQPTVLVGQDAKCKAANNIIAEFQANVAGIAGQLTIGGGIAGLTGVWQGLLAWVFAVPVIGWAAGIAAAAAAVIGFAGAAFAAAFTQDVWDELESMLYCNMSDDMSFTESQWYSLYYQIQGAFNGAVSIHLSNLMNLLGPVGLTNIARTDHGTYNEVNCSCNDCAASFEIINGTLISQDGCILTIQSAPIPGATTYQSVDVQGTNGYCWSFVPPYFTSHGQDFPHANYGNYCDGTPSDPIVTSQCISRATIQGFQYGAQFTIQLDLSGGCV